MGADLRPGRPHGPHGAPHEKRTVPDDTMTGMTSARGLRLARSAILAAMCVVVSGLGHAMMSGGDVPVWLMVYAFGCVTAGAWWLTGRARGPLLLCCTTVVTQAALHMVFMLGQTMTALPPGASDGAADTTGTPGMDSMDGMPAPGTRERLPGTAGMPAGHAMHMREWSLGMLAVHCAAAVLCGLWLWRGEVAVTRLGRALASFLTTPLRRANATRVALPPPAAAPAAGRRDPRRPAEVLLRHLLVRRGPPNPPEFHRQAPV